MTELGEQATEFWNSCVKAIHAFIRMCLLTGHAVFTGIGKGFLWCDRRFVEYIVEDKVTRGESGCLKTS